MADKSLKDLTNAVYKIAEDSPKIQKDVKDIRDAICGTDGIRDSIIYLTKQLDTIQKKGTLNRLTAKPTGDVNRNLLRYTNNISNTLNKILYSLQRSPRNISLTGSNNMRVSGGRTLGDISQSIGIVNSLKGIKLKDFIFAKKKIKNIQKIMSRYLATFRMFKDQKEMEGTLNFANSSVDLMKKLSKISIISVPAKIGAKTIQKIFLGNKRDKNGGLIGLFRIISKNKEHIEKGKKSMKDILSSCGSMFLTTIILTGIAAVSIPAMVGALLMKGVIWLLTGTFIALEKVRRPVKKGSQVLLLLSASVITFSLGLGLMLKAVKGMKLKDVGIMMASIAGIGLTAAGVGLLAAPIALGSASLLLLSASLGVFGLALSYWKSIDTKPAMDNIKTAVGGLREIFGFELGKKDEKKTVIQRLGGGLMDIAVGVLNFGSSFFIMGQLLLAGAALGLLYHGIKKWDNFNGLKAAANIKLGIGALNDAFGIGNNKNENLSGKVKRLGGGLLDMGIALFQGGKALAQMATLTVATGLADVIRVTLIPWKNYDSKPAANNIKEAFASLTDAFGLNNKPNEKITLGKVFGSTLDMANTILKSGGVLTKMGTIMLATGLADVIKLNLKPWENYTGSEKAMANIKTAVNGLLDMFGIGKMEEPTTDNSGFFKRIGKTLKSLGGVVSSTIDTVGTVAKGGAALAKVSTITSLTKILGDLKTSLEPWENYNAEKAMVQINKSLNGTVETINAVDVTKAAKVIEVFKSFSKVNGKPIDSFAKAVNKFSESCTDLIDSLNNFGITSTSSENGQGTSTETIANGNINISNKEELAMAIAKAIKSLPVNVRTDISDVKLVINNETGKRVILTLDN